MKIYSNSAIDRSIIAKQTDKEINIKRQLPFDTVILSKKNKNKSVSFGAIEIVLEIPQFMIQMRARKLRKLGLSELYVQRISRLDSDKYKKALELISLGVFEEGIESTTELDDEKYEQALELVKHNINSEDLASLAKLEGDSYKRVIDLKDKGIDTEQIGLFVNLNDDNYEEAIKLLKQGFTPVEAASLASLTEEQKKLAKSLLETNTSIEIAAEIAQMEESLRAKCIELIHKGIHSEEVTAIASLEDEHQEKLDEIIKMNVGDENITDFAKFSDEQYKKAVNLFKEGILPEYISSIIAIEEGKITNPEYNEYRERGYSHSISYALSLFDNEEIKELERIIKKNPEIKDLLKEEYDISLIELQDNKKSEAIFCKEMRCNNGTQITLVQTFDKDGNHTKSRVEEYSNHATSSILSRKSDVYKAKYDKFGEIKELSQFIQDKTTHEVTGVIHSKASTLLSGVFESVYYDISEFITSNSNDENEVDFDIDKSVKTKGTPISKVTRADDGTVIYDERIKQNECTTNRTYKEKKDDIGSVTYSYYSYEITDKNNKPLMQIKREYRKLDENHAINVINGVQYDINYDNENKKIKISDGKRTKEISFNNKLAYYSQEILWETIKQLPVDTLITIDNHVDKWNYCREEDSAADGYTNTISTGKLQSVITHETGHFKDYENESSTNHKKFIKSYNEEMKTFLNTTPYNEQEFVQYFSPRAALNDAVGRSEFTAETNIILTTFGTDHNRLKTRAQFLVRYFPKTIAIVADFLGKTSNKSLLEED